MTHLQAIQLHKLALNAHWLSTEFSMVLVPGGLYWLEKQADEADAEAWRATRGLFPGRDFAGSSHAAIEAHEEADRLERAAAEVALDDAADRWPL